MYTNELRAIFSVSGSYKQIFISEFMLLDYYYIIL